MARIACAWEFGGDLGHVGRLLPIARALREIGHEPVLAFREIGPLGAFVDEGFEWFPAPRLRPPAVPNASPLSASDVLLNVGFGDPSGLAGALRAWLSGFATWEISGLVADYAPGALLAARLSGLPRVTVGSGFSVPPAADPLPALRDWSPVEASVLREIDRRLIANVEQAITRVSSAQPPQRAADLFEARVHLLCTEPGIDPFGPRDDQRVEYVGTIAAPSEGIAVEWRERKGPRVFAYLKPRDPRFGPLVAALRAIGANAIVAAPGLEPEAAQRASDAGVRIVAGAVKLQGLLEEADLCLCHAGAGLAAQALAAGVPLALLPMQLEQFLVARRLASAGVAEYLPPEGALPDLAQWLEGLVAREDLRRAARAWADAPKDVATASAARRAAERIDRAMAA